MPTRNRVEPIASSEYTSSRALVLIHDGHFTSQSELKEIQETYFLPPFVTAGQVGTFVEMLGELQDAKERRVGGMSMILREIKSQLKNNETTADPWP